VWTRIDEFGAEIYDCFLLESGLRVVLSHGMHRFEGSKAVQKHTILIALFFGCAILGVQPNDSLKVIVFPLENGTASASLGWLSEGIALSLSEQMACHSIRPVSREERMGLIESLDLPPGALLSRASMIKVAQKATADWVVFGRYTGRENNISIAVRILNVRSLKLSGIITASGPISAMPQIENELAWLILKNSGLEKAFSRESFAQHTRKIPNEAYSLFIQGLGQRNEKERLQMLLKAVQIYRYFPAAQLEIGRYYFLHGECKRALSHLMLAAEGDMVTPAVSHMCGTCYLYTDQPDKAIEAFSRIEDAYRGYETLNNLGVAYLLKGDVGQALSNFQAAADKAPSDATVTLNRAIALHLEGNDKLSIGLLEQGLKVHPRDGMLQFVLGYLLNGIGQREKASAALERARKFGVSIDQLSMQAPGRWARMIGPGK